MQEDTNIESGNALCMYIYNKLHKPILYLSDALFGNRQCDVMGNNI